MIDITIIKNLLVEKNKTQSGLAQALGRDKSAVTNLLRGKRQLKAHEIPVIAEFLDVTEAELLGVSELSGAALQESPLIKFSGVPSSQLQQTGRFLQKGKQWYMRESQPVHPRHYLIEVGDRSLDLEGIIPGDLVTCDPDTPCQAGDTVVVEIAQDNQPAITTLRKYQPPFLNSHSTREKFERLHEDRGSVSMRAKVVFLQRLFV